MERFEIPMTDLEQFNEWNPYVGTDCESLWLDYYVCVDAPST